MDAEREDHYNKYLLECWVKCPIGEILVDNQLSKGLSEF